MKRRILTLTLKRKSFEIMISGEKKIEYRNSSVWILSRLSKEYDTIKFINGYGKNMPFFICDFLGWDFNEEETEITFSNGHKVFLVKGLVRIFLGEVMESGNL